MATRQRISEALTAAAPGLEELARRLGLSSSALRRYRLGDRTPSSDVLARVAIVLREQAKDLLRLAKELETDSKTGV